MANDLPYFIQRATGPLCPILVSVPHSGTEFPQSITPPLKTKFRQYTPDTDWLVHELYNFVPAMGITLIHARYSRYLIDLNRDPKGAALYSDGRQETALVPIKSFRGERLYDNEGPSPDELESRIQHFFNPYYARIESELSDLKKQFGQVVFYDAHSIARMVPTIQSTPFPDVILGNQDGRTAGKPVISAALGALRAPGTGLNVAHNEPFKGGYLTRFFGKPEQHIHALQLEMSQDVYLLDQRGEGDKDHLPQLDLQKVTPLRLTLTKMFESIIASLLNPVKN